MTAVAWACIRCGRTADYACETGKVTAPRKERRGGIDVVVQGFETYHVCADCAPAEATSDTPPHDHAARAPRPQARRREGRGGKRPAGRPRGGPGEPRRGLGATVTLVDWSGPLTERPLPCSGCVGEHHTARCATEAEVRRLLDQLEAASTWIAERGGDPKAVLRA